MDPGARHPVVAEELKLLHDVTTVLNESPPESAVSPSEATLLDDLARLREALREGEKTEDRAALLEQWDRQSALLDQLRTSDDRRRR